MPCPCCNQCVPCVCSPAKCLDLVAFGGGCLACLPTGTRVPITQGPFCGACPNHWVRACDSVPALDCSGSALNYKSPNCCTFPAGNTTCPIIRPPGTPTPCNLTFLPPGTAVDRCDPMIDLECLFANNGVRPPQNSYFLRIMWHCAVGQPGGRLEAWSSAVQCDPFQITFTEFEQFNTAFDIPYLCTGTPCGGSPPSSIIIIPHA